MQIKPHGNKGVPKTEEHKAKIRQAMKGRTFTKEHLAKLAAAKIGNDHNLKYRTTSDMLPLVQHYTAYGQLLIVDTYKPMKRGANGQVRVYVKYLNPQNKSHVDGYRLVQNVIRMLEKYSDDT